VQVDSWLPVEGIAGQLHLRAKFTVNIPYLLPKQQMPLPSRFQIGLAWDFGDNDPADLDASVAGFNARFEHLESVSFQRLAGFEGAVSHSGDDRTGDGDGDDETITFDMEKVPEEVEALALCINSYSGTPISKVSFAHVRIIVDGKTHGCFCFSGTRIKACSGFFIGFVQKSQGEGWEFLTVAAAAEGRTLDESLPAIAALASQNLKR